MATVEASLPKDENYIEPPKKGFIAGVEVEFPTKPYPCQYGTMNMVIKGLRHMTNTLIECPTGTGKTLSLICATLAWQKAEAARLKEVMEKEAKEEFARREEEIVKERMGMEMEIRRQIEHRKKNLLEKEGNKPEEKEEYVPERRKLKKPSERMVIYMSDSEDDMDDFNVQPKKINMMTDEASFIVPKDLSSLTQPLDILSPILANPDMPNIGTHDDNHIMLTGDLLIEKTKVSKIFYCSRTHQQLQQVVRELRKTAYKDIKMTILSSREHTCIQTTTKNSRIRSKTELCKTLLDSVEGRGCSFFSAVNRMGTHKALEENCHLTSPWDLEDLVAAGKKIRACPYFSARELIAESEIVFCPYVYLIDPKILNSMRINLKGSVILLDEAHNIEDCCRDSASCSISYNEIEETVKDCRRVEELKVLPEVHNELANFLSNLMAWMSEKIRLTNHYSNEREMVMANTLDGISAVASFEIHGINMQSIQRFKFLASCAIAEANKDENKEQTKKSFKRFGVAPSTIFILEALHIVLSFMYDNNMAHIKDYYVAMTKSPIVTNGGIADDWLTTANDEPGHESRGYYINFLCMNPAVVFKPIADTARSIVLASGTLSPLLTFASELGTAFTNELQAAHIVAPTQVWVGVLGCGPKGKELTCTYKNTEMTDFRNELGSTILNICRIVPFGVLCFLPSYTLLENLRLHWMKTGLWSELVDVKEVFCESRSSRDHLSTVEMFNESVKQCEDGYGRGPILFAIMRGKASEGMDFGNNMARGVITVGIPYPHVFDIQVALKRKYNDANVSQGLKSGNSWYETQAYRALNQALGRCIRHKNDWGALIVIDNRFLMDKRHCEGLSKWIRDKVQRFGRYEKFDASLKDFIHFHTGNIKMEWNKLEKNNAMDALPML